MTTSAPTPITAPIADTKRASAAYAKLQAEIDAVPETKLLRINVDIPKTVSMVLGAWPAISSLREKVIAEAAGFPIDQLDKLPDYAFAALYTHLLAMPASSSSSPVQPMLEEAVALREDLLVAADALVHVGIFDGPRVAEIRKGSGHVDIASDLVALAALFDDKWDAVANKTAATREAIDRAAALGAELITALGARFLPSGEALPVAAAATRRARAFTLFMNAYDACRRVVAFLRWNEGDADSIAPSPFLKGARRRGTEVVDVGAATDPAGTALPAVASAAPSLATAPVALPASPAPVTE
ncbi:MAG: hypothetical protein WKG00_11665 [Polyangiaceae bacterium]